MKLQKKQGGDTTFISDRTSVALRNPYNILGISISVASTAISLSPDPLIVGLVLEIIYLSICSARSAAAPSDESSPQTNSALTSERGQSSPAATLVGDSQERYLRLEATYRLVKLQVDDSEPVYRDLLQKLEYLMDRFVFFALKQEQFSDRLEAIVAEARALTGGTKLAPGVVDLQLVYSPGDRDNAQSLDEWVQLRLKQAHDGFEREMRDLAWRRDQGLDAAIDADLERRGQSMLRRTRFADKIAKTLLNLHYELQLLDKKFQMTSQELSTRRPDQVLSDLQALVLQTQSLTRTVEELEPSENPVSYAAA